MRASFAKKSRNGVVWRLPVGVYRDHSQEDRIPTLSEGTDPIPGGRAQDPGCRALLSQQRGHLGSCGTGMWGPVRALAVLQAPLLGAHNALWVLS